MDVREKLVELLTNAIISSDDNYGFPDTNQVADRLIVNGVTVVVRCKDCIHCYDDLCGLCCTCGPFVDCVVQPEFYCADGKRKREARGVE